MLNGSSLLFYPFNTRITAVCSILEWPSPIVCCSPIPFSTTKVIIIRDKKGPVLLEPSQCPGMQAAAQLC